MQTKQTNKRHVLRAAAAAAACAALWGLAQAQTLPPPPVSPAPVVNYEYDAQGNPTKTVQAPGAADFTTRASYDTLNRMKDTTDAKSGVTRFGYDGLDRTTQVTDPRNLVTRYPRNGLGDTTQLISPDTGTAALTYDTAGNLKTRTDSRGVKATFSYDVLDRLTALTYSQTGQTSISFVWQYDLAGVPYSIGRLGSANFPGGSLRYTYDAHGRVLTQRLQLAATAGANAAQLLPQASYGYDAAGHVTSILYPSGRKLSITYTGGVPTAIALAPNATAAATTLVSQIQWQPFGPAKSWQWHLASGPQAHERVFDTSGRPVRYRLGNTIRDLTYDAADRISAYTHYDAATAAPQPTLDQGFGYDELGRLIQTTLYAGSLSFSYDANGNRTAASIDGNARSYAVSATSNRIDSISNPARSFSYDAAGNTTADGQFSATYDLTGRMKTLTKAGITTTYTYDNDGRRVRKFDSTGAASTVAFVYDLDGHLLGEYDQTGKAIREYVWLGDIPLAVFMPDPVSTTNPPLVYFIHTDHLDTPRVIVDKNNALRWRWFAEPFGTTVPESNPSGLGNLTFPLRFPGQYFDQESGLHYNYFRSYDSTIGRYTTSDPIGLDGGINTYAYVEGNPTDSVDPLGLNRRTATNPQLTYTAQLNAVQVSSLLTQIRRYDPSFTYETIRPSHGPGSTYSRIDVNALSTILRTLQTNQTCSRDGVQVGRFIADQRGNVMIEPVGGSTGPYPPHRPNSPDTHTYYPNGSNYMRNNPRGHGSNTTPHGHGHLPGTGIGRSGQGSSTDIFGNVVPSNSPAAHWPTY